MNVYEPGQRRRSKARERSMVRQSKRGGMANLPSWRDKIPNVAIPGLDADKRQRARIFMSDLLWYITHTRAVQLAFVGVMLLVFIAFAGSHVLNYQIFPNVWAAGVNLGDMTVEQASTALAIAWEDEITIQLVDGDRTWSVKPVDLGMSIDTLKTAESARNVGMAGMPMGWNVPPVVSIDFNTAQNYLLDLTSSTDIPPYNAGYKWQDGVLVGVDGTDGRMLNIPAVMDALTGNLVEVVQTGRLELAMSPLAPDVVDAEPYLEEAQALVSQPFTVYGYDPFEDQTVSWSTSTEVFASWLEAGQNGLTLRDAAYSTFLDAQNRSLNSDGKDLRYLDPLDTKDKLRQAISQQANNVTVRIHYRPTQYEIVSGDTGFRISRKTGIPFFEIQAANPGRDWAAILSPGEVIQLPSRDVAIKLDPVPTKRIVVNLNTQTLAAFENGQLVFNWLISSGLEDYPTSPGVYQILNHDEVAEGSSFTLCNSGGDCGQWEMYWFMGMYEVGPGLMNGFHGAVLLPNGAYLGGGNVGAPYTFGCVMSRDDQGKLLYEWADDGTIVEIVSNEFSPTSELGELVWAGQFAPSV